MAKGRPGLNLALQGARVASSTGHVPGPLKALPGHPEGPGLGRS